MKPKKNYLQFVGEDPDKAYAELCGIESAQKRYYGGHLAGYYKDQRKFIKKYKDYI